VLEGGRNLRQVVFDLHGPNASVRRSMISSFWGAVNTHAMTVTRISAILSSSWVVAVAIVHSNAAAHIGHIPDIDP